MKFYAVFTDSDNYECDKQIFDADDLRDALKQASLHWTSGVNCFIDCKSSSKRITNTEVTSAGG